MFRNFKKAADSYTTRHQTKSAFCVHSLRARDTMLCAHGPANFFLFIVYAPVKAG